MNKNTFQVGDLVDFSPKMKRFAPKHLGLAIIVGTKHKSGDVREAKIYTLLWPTGETGEVHRDNIQLVE